MSCRVISTPDPYVHAVNVGQLPASLQHIPSPCQITFSPLLLRRIVSHMRSCLPVEGVGLVATRSGKHGLIAEAYYPGTNIMASPTRFTMDPRQVQWAIDDMAHNKTSLGAIVHSHPTTVAAPSPIDLREANLADVLSIIVGFAPRLSVRAWRLLFSSTGKALDAVECPIYATMADVSSGARSLTLDDWPTP